MKIIGIVLIVMQVMSLMGGFPSAPGGSGYAIGFYLGYFAPGIAGVILLIKGINKAKKEEDSTEEG